MLAVERQVGIDAGQSSGYFDETVSIAAAKGIRIEVEVGCLRQHMFPGFPCQFELRR